MLGRLDDPSALPDVITAITLTELAVGTVTWSIAKRVSHFTWRAQSPVPEPAP